MRGDVQTDGTGSFEPYRAGDAKRQECPSDLKMCMQMPGSSLLSPGM